MRNAIRSVLRKLDEVRGREVVAPLDVRIPSVFLGSEYGGWVVATKPLPERPTIFSVGLGRDISFDLAAIDRLKAHVHGFDPTPKSRQFILGQQLPGDFTYVPVGLAAYDGMLTLRLPHAEWDSYTSDAVAGAAVDTVECPVERLSTLAARLGVTSIDVLKMDIEGGEYESVPDILNTPLPIGQLLVELHYDKSPAQIKRAADLIAAIRAAGYRLFSRSAVGKEFSFIHLSRL